MFMYVLCICPRPIQFAQEMGMSVNEMVEEFLEAPPQISEYFPVDQSRKPGISWAPAYRAPEENPHGWDQQWDQWSTAELYFGLHPCGFAIDCKFPTPDSWTLADWSEGLPQKSANISPVNPTKGPRAYWSGVNTNIHKRRQGGIGGS